MMNEMSNNNNSNTDIKLLECKKDSKTSSLECNKTEELHLYKRRWVIIILYGLCSASSSFQWIQYSIISNIISRYATFW